MVLFFESFQASLHSFLEFGIIFLKIRMYRLHAHPLIITKCVDIQRKEFAHFDVDERPVVNDPDIKLFGFDSCTGQHKAVVHLHKRLPLIFERLIHPVIELRDQLVEQVLLHF